MKISVYITSYNQRDLLARAIDSVLNQTLRPSQIIVVDDCSTDDSQTLIRSYHARHPQLFTPVLHQQNQGVARTRIDALNAVTGDYVTSVDGDDRFLPDKLEAEAQILATHPHADFVYSNYRIIDQRTNDAEPWTHDAPHAHGELSIPTLTRNFPKSTMFRHELVKYASWRDIGFHDPSLAIYEDWEMRIRFIRHLNGIYVDRILSEYWISGGGLSSAPADEHDRIIGHIVRKHRDAIDTLSPDDRRALLARLYLWRSAYRLIHGVNAFRRGRIDHILIKTPAYLTILHARRIANAYLHALNSRNTAKTKRYARLVDRHCTPHELNG